ncbi:MAG: hypothetical protein GY835_14000 [bacterium]|nr:hypothetical protein [bacterium]
MRYIKLNGVFRLLFVCLFLPLLPVACDRGEEGDLVLSQDNTTASTTTTSLDYFVRIGDHTLSEDEFLRLLPEEFRGMLTYEEKLSYLQRWADTELLYLAAVSRDLLDDPVLVQKLKQQQREFVANHLLQQMLEERVVVTETEISDFYAEHLDEYASEYRYREIVVRSQQEAEEIYRNLKSKKISFSRAAEKHSQSSSARVGGDMGWLAKGAMPPEVEERIVKMKPKEISQPFETAWGWTIIYFREKRQSSNALDLLEVKDEILRYLMMERRRRVYREYLEELQQSYPIIYHPQLEARLRANEFVPDSGQNP